MEQDHNKLQEGTKLTGAIMGYKILAGRYEIHGKLGDGGMAVVYKARDKLLNRMVALKVLRPEYVRDASFVDNFRRESRAAASLSHPNIVSIYDVGKEGNIYFIVMELVEGRTLAEVIHDEAPMEFRRVISISKQIASALSLAHRNNIIHRDVKPQNILIQDDDAAKITDFGIAKAVTDRTTVSDSETIIGSVHYFSPEQGRGQYVDEKSDIYSLGIVMFEMITGQVPFDADNPVTIAVMHMNDRLPQPSSLVSGVPPGLEQIIVKATEKYQVSRFATVDELYQALDHVDYITGRITDPEMAAYVQPSAVEEYDDEQIDPQNYDENYDEEDIDDYDDEYDDEDEKKPKKRSAGKGRGKKVKNKNKKPKDKNRRYRTLGIILAIVLALGLAYPIYLGANWVMGQFQKAPEETVTVPDLSGKTETEAQLIIDELELTLEVGDAVYTTDEEIGCVADQDPKPDTEVNKGDKVTIYLSKGVDPEMVDFTVPDLLGKSKSSAEYAIIQAGYTLGNVTYIDSDKPIDTVVDQYPEAGADIEQGETIDLVISNGPKIQESTMPNIVGLTEAKAKKALENAGLVLGKVTKEYSDSYKAGTVMWQQYKKGTKLAPGRAVNIKVSQGPKDKTSTVNIDIPFTDAPDETFLLTVVLVNADGTQKNIIKNQESFMSSGGQTVSVTGKGTGAKVVVYFDNKKVMTFNVNFNTGKYS